MVTRLKPNLTVANQWLNSLNNISNNHGHIFRDDNFRFLGWGTIYIYKYKI